MIGQSEMVHFEEWQFNIENFQCRVRKYDNGEFSPCYVDSEGDWCATDGRQEAFDTFVRAVVELQDQIERFHD